MANTKRKSDTGKPRKKMALGRGLGALIPDIETIDGKTKDYFLCDVEIIRPNRFQPRRRFAEKELAQLSDSIKTQGIIQPLLVRKNEDGYELVAGERRLRAAQMAGLNRVPVVLKEVPDTDLLEMSIIENIQRQDLNPMEEAEAYHRLMTEFGLTQELVSQRIGKSRSAVANFLRLRQLPEEIKACIRDTTLSMGHARALLGADSTAQQIAAFRAVVSKKLSVRETEALVKRLKTEAAKPSKTSENSEQRHLAGLAEELSRSFGTKVQIKRRGKKGRVEIEFYSNEDLDRLLSLLQSK